MVVMTVFVQLKLSIPISNPIVAKLVDAPDLGSGGEIRVGASPIDGTTFFKTPSELKANLA